MTKHKQLDLLVINPGSRMQTYQALGSELTALEPPVWAGLLATFIRNHGYSVRILDANAENLSPEETAEQAAELAPKLTTVVVYGHQPSASTQVMPFTSAFCTALKRISPQQKILLSGGHVAALPERTLREEDADFVCSGEGPYTTLDLLQALGADCTDYSQVRGLWYSDGDTVRATPPAPLVLNLNQEMPEMAWDLLPMETYRAHNWHCFEHLDQRQPYASLYTTLGCPYHCSYCCIQTPFKNGEKLMGYKEKVNSYRFWSPQKVIAQIDKLVNEYGVCNIKFADEMFVLNQQHVLDICDLIIARGYKLNIWAYARIDSIKYWMLDKLKQAGVNWLCFGIESASERVRNDVRKDFEQDKAYKVIDAVRKAGINVIGNYIFGLPEDDLESMQATLDLAVELNCEFANFYCAMAYPGSELYNIAITEGWPLPEKWSGYSQHSADSLPLPTKHLSGVEVLRFRDRAFQKYFNNFDYLEMITQKFGPIVKEHIGEMVSFKLERKYVQ